MRDQHRLLLLVLLLVVALGCRKDKDDTPPTVRILAPGSGMSISVPDTLTVRVEVADDRIVRSVVISLNDVNGIPVAQPVTVTVDAPSAVIERDLVVADERLGSGTYTLTARATDGSNERNAFRSIQVQAAPLRLRALFITPPFGNQGGVVQRVDSTGVMSAFTTVQDLNGAAIDSYHQRLILAGSASAPLVAIPTAAGAGSWQQPNLNAESIPYFEGLRVDPTDGRIYFATNDGFIRGFTGTGSQTYTAQALQSFRAMRMVVVGERLVSVQQSISLPERRLVTQAYASGALIGQFALDLDVVGMYRRTDQHALIFGNRDGTGVIQDRNVQEGGSFEPREFAGTVITATERLDDNTWVIALAGQLIRYGHSSNSISPLANGFTATTLAYEAATGTLYAGVDDQLITLDPLTGAMTGTYSMPGGVGRILPLLNR
jgi:hypothetical protein